MSSILGFLHRELGLRPDQVEGYALEPCEEAPLKDLEVVQLDHEGKPILLEKTAAKAWTEMRRAAAGEDVSLEPFSGFRSFQYQKNLIAHRLKQGRPLEVVITHIAIPGFSEHHTGRAVDICTKDDHRLGEFFEKTPSFLWLTENANSFGFSLSYPKDNFKKIIYEPWHWCFKGDQ